MATKLRKTDNTFISGNEILTMLNNAGGVTYANPGGGTENYFQVPDVDGELVDSFLQVGDLTAMLASANIDVLFYQDLTSAQIGNLYSSLTFFSSNTLEMSSYAADDDLSRAECQVASTDDYAEFSVSGNSMTSSKTFSIYAYADTLGHIELITDRFKISGIPTSSAGLSAGDVWNDSGTLKIV